jgi:hypothetical protein
MRGSSVPAVTEVNGLVAETCYRELLAYPAGGHAFEAVGSELLGLHLTILERICSHRAHFQLDVIFRRERPRSVHTVIGMQLRYNYRAYPDAPQRRALARAFGCARVVWNDCLRDRKEAHAAGLPYVKSAELSGFASRKPSAPRNAPGSPTCQP